MSCHHRRAAMRSTTWFATPKSKAQNAYSSTFSRRHQRLAQRWYSASVPGARPFRLVQTPSMFMSILPLSSQLRSPHHAEQADALVLQFIPWPLAILGVTENNILLLIHQHLVWRVLQRLTIPRVMWIPGGQTSILASGAWPLIMLTTF